MSFKARWGALCMVVMIMPVICFAADPVPPSNPDPVQTAGEMIRQARERSERIGVVLGNMTTSEVYDFYTRRNDLYKHNLMKASGAYNALEFLRPIEAARGMDPQVIMNRLRTETDPAERAALIARLPQSVPFVQVEADAAIRKRIGELAAEAAKLKAEEVRHREDLDRTEEELKAAKRRVPRDEGEIGRRLEEKWEVLGKIEAIHRRLVEFAIEGNMLRDYVAATNKDAKVAGIARAMGNDLRLFTGEIKDGKPSGGMSELWADIQANIAANRQAIAMPYQPGQAFFLKLPTTGNSANPWSSGLLPPVAGARPLPTYALPSQPLFVMPQSVVPITIQSPGSLMIR